MTISAPHRQYQRIRALTVARIKKAKKLALSHLPDNRKSLRSLLSQSTTALRQYSNKALQANINCNNSNRKRTRTSSSIHRSHNIMLIKTEDNSALEETNMVIDNDEDHDDGETADTSMLIKKDVSVEEEAVASAAVAAVHQIKQEDGRNESNVLVPATTSTTPTAPTTATTAATTTANISTSVSTTAIAGVSGTTTNLSTTSLTTTSTSRSDNGCCKRGRESEIPSSTIQPNTINSTTTTKTTPTLSTSTSLPQIHKLEVENPIIMKPTPAKSAGIACIKRLPPPNITEEKKEEPLDLSNPQDLLLNYLREDGYKAYTRKSSTLSNFFLEITPEQIEAYSTELVKAIRDRNISFLREMHQAGKTLQCSNRFGESLLHMACRRGYTDVVRFLIKEAQVSLRVKDDFGRTPLHDACWSADPNFDLMELIMDHDPDLLLIEDVRGHSPFSYARRSHWKDWIDFLTARRETLRLNTFAE